MLRTFTSFVNETVNDAYENGINLFLETLENDLEKDLYIKENGIEAVLQESFNIQGTDVDDNVEDVTNIE